MTAGVTFTAAGTASFASGKNMTGNVTATASDGTITTVGDTTITGLINATSHVIHLRPASAHTIAITGTTTATTASIDDTGTASFGDTVTSGVTFTAAGTASFASGKNMTGNVTATASDGTITTVGDTTITGLINATSHVIHLRPASTHTLTITGTTAATTASIDDTGTASFGDTVTSGVAFTAAGTASFADSVSVTGSIDNTSGQNSTGSVIAVGTTTITGNIGTSASNHRVQLVQGGAASKTLTITGNTYTSGLKIASSGTVALGSGATNVSNNIDFNNAANGRVTVADGGTLTYANFANVTGGGSNIGFLGSGTMTSSANLGTTLPLISAGVSGKTVTFAGNIDVTDIQASGAGTLVLHGATISGGINVGGGNTGVHVQVGAGASAIATLGSADNNVSDLTFTDATAQLTITDSLTGIASVITNNTGSAAGTLILSGGSTLQQNIGSSTATGLAVVSVANTKTLDANGHNVYAQTISSGGSTTTLDLSNTSSSISGGAGTSGNPFGTIKLNGQAPAGDYYAQTTYNIQGTVNTGGHLKGGAGAALNNAQFYVAQNDILGEITSNHAADSVFFVGGRTFNAGVSAQNGVNFLDDGAYIFNGGRSITGRVVANNSPEFTVTNGTLTVTDSITANGGMVWNLGANTVNINNGGVLRGAVIINLSTDGTDANTGNINVVGGTLDMAHITTLTINVLATNASTEAVRIFSASNITYVDSTKVVVKNVDRDGNQILHTDIHLADNNYQITYASVEPTPDPTPDPAPTPVHIPSPKSHVPTSSLTLLDDTANQKVHTSVRDDLSKNLKVLLGSGDSPSGSIVVTIDAPTIPATDKSVAKAITNQIANLDDASPQEMKYAADIFNQIVGTNGSASALEALTKWVPATTMQTSGTAQSASMVNQSVSASISNNFTISPISNQHMYISMNNRMDDISDNDPIGTGISAGDTSKKLGVWVNGFGGAAKQGILNGNVGYMSHTYGGSIGVDKEFTDALVSGLAITLSDTKIKYKSLRLGDATKVKPLIGSLYGMYDFSNNWYARGILSYGHIAVENLSHRVTGFNLATNQQVMGVAVGKHKSKTTGIDLSTGYAHKMKGNLIVMPSVALQYNHFVDLGYQETGVKNYSTISTRVSDELLGVLGLRLASSFNLMDSVIVPGVHVYMRNRLRGRNPDIVTRSVGFDSINTSYKPVKTSYILGASTTLKRNGLDVSFGVNSNISNKYVGYQGNMKIMMNF